MVEFVVGSETETEAVDSGDNGESVRALTSEFHLEDSMNNGSPTFGHAGDKLQPASHDLPIMWLAEAALLRIASLWYFRKLYTRHVFGRDPETAEAT